MKALVLAGGGALGSYEVGAYKKLIEMGYKFDIITGTSIGALNGAFLAADMFSEAQEMWNEITPDMVMSNGVNIDTKSLALMMGRDGKELRNFALSYVKNKFSTDIEPFKKYIAERFDIDKLLNSKIKLGIMTTKFPTFTGNPVEVQKLEKDKVLPFLHASSACFPVFPVEKIDDKKYVDGFYTDNMPIEMAFNMGATEIVAVDMRLFGLKPKKPYLLNLPNVTYIAPYVSLGSMLDFSQEAIQLNIKRGELDTLKVFKKLRGFHYNFEAEVKKSNFISLVINEYAEDSEKIFDELTNEIYTKMDEIDYFYRAIEIAFEKFKVDKDLHVYTLEEAINVLTNYEKEKPKGIINNVKNAITNLMESDLLSSFIDFFIENINKFYEL